MSGGEATSERDGALAVEESALSHSRMRVQEIRRFWLRRRRVRHQSASTRSETPQIREGSFRRGGAEEVIVELGGASVLAEGVPGHPLESGRDHHQCP